MKAVILAGGKGTRLAPYTTVFPKPLMPIEGMPILEVVVRQLAHFGIRDLIFAVSRQSEPLLSAYFGDGSQFGVKVAYTREDEPLGTAGPLSRMKNLPSSFLVMNGDILTTLDYGRLIRYHEQRKPMITIAMSQKKVSIDYGVLEFDAAHRLTHYREKPVLSYSVSMGVYVFDREVLTWIPRDRYFDFPDLIQKLLKKGEKILCYPSQDFWLDIGRHEDYEEAQKRFQKMRRKLLRE
jgi:NDP-sugar pyrophosphorylase family protein